MERTAEGVTVERFMTGPLETNTYVLSQTGDACVVVDPSRGCTEVLENIGNRGRRAEAVVLTHGHFDHVMGIPEVLDRFPGIDVWIHPDERVLLSKPEYNGSTMIGDPFTYTGPLRDLEAGDMTLGGVSLSVLHVPGHSPGGCALVFGGVCLSGDSLFAGSIGRTDFPGGDYDQLISGVKGKLLALPDETVVYPGHGNRTTIGRERSLNPFLQ